VLIAVISLVALTPFTEPAAGINNTTSPTSNQTTLSITTLALATETVVSTN